MASTDELSESNFGVKVNGDLALQVIAESESDSDESEEDPRVVQRVMTLDNLKHIPAEIVPSPHSSVFGNSVITNSEHVHLGHNTYFHGNVTIKQIIHTKPGVENASYTKTDDDDIPSSKDVKENPTDSSVASKFKFQLWHKVLCTVIVLVVIAVICANILLLRNQNNPAVNLNQPSSNYNVDPDTSSCVMVVGVPYIMILENAVMLLIIAWVLAALCALLTRSSVWKKHTLPTPLPVYPNHDHDKKLAEQLLIAPNHLRFVSRDEWLAQPPTGVLDKLRLPAPWVIIAHTATDSCYSQSKCVLRVRTVQSFHVDSRGWFDIGYNFLVGGDGSAYVGRGWDYVGAHTKGYNIYSISIAFIGTFTTETPPKQQIDACLKLIAQGLELGKIDKDYKLFAHRQLMSTASPGEKLFEIMKEWPHFVNNVSNVDALLPKYR